MDDSPENDLPLREPDMPDDALGLGLDQPASPAAPQSPVVPSAPAADSVSAQSAVSETGSAYRVLARKYRPQSFSQLIGQDAMIQTLGNAIKRDRLAHAFLMTGVRGVGKTSTARLIAKSLNCIGPDGQGGPTIDPCGQCEPCQAITEGRHIDVIEMDAASHTGVDDVREIIEAVRYAAVSARYKIYIIDEVHMLSKNAFNALLKTLEEPPAHVKFLFATTEVNKVPITVLSRCQRFDLKRISVERLTAHFVDITGKEQVEAEEDALKLVAQAAEGSVRDGLSILDQAIAHSDMAKDDGGGDGKITAAQLRGMLGLSDRSAIRRLFGLILLAEAQQVLKEVAEQYALGVEPQALLSGLLSEVHRLTLAKIGAPHDPALPDDARDESDEHADSMSFAILHRLWQLLLKGHDEVTRAASPREACDMALLRVVHGAAMPDPGELARAIENNGTGASGDNPDPQSAPENAPQAQASQPATAQTQAAQPEQVQPEQVQPEQVQPEQVQSEKTVREPAALGQAPPVYPATFAELLDLLGQHNFINLEMTLRDVMRVAEYSPPLLAYQIAGSVPADFLKELDGALKSVTGTRWQLEQRTGEVPPSMYEIERAAQEDKRQAILASPLVKAALEAFPDAEIIQSRQNEEEHRSASA